MFRKMSEEDKLALQTFTIDGMKREIDLIRSRRKKKGDFEYEVQWKNLPSIKYNKWYKREVRTCSARYCFMRAVSSIRVYGVLGIWAACAGLVITCFDLLCHCHHAARALFVFGLRRMTCAACCSVQRSLQRRAAQTEDTVDCARLDTYTKPCCCRQRRRRTCASMCMDLTGARDCAGAAGARVRQDGRRVQREARICGR